MLPLLIGQKKCCVTCYKGKGKGILMQLTICAVSSHHMAVVAYRFRRVRLPIGARTVNRLIPLGGRQYSLFVLQFLF